MKMDVISKGIQDSLGALVDEVLKTSTNKVDKELSEFKNKVFADFSALAEKLPVLKVQINELPSVKISSRVSPVLPKLILNSKLGLYTMLVGPAGCGKTTMASQLAEALELQFASVCLTSGASETWLFGRQTPNGFVEGPFAKLYREGGVFLADEMDAADANLLLSLNTALSHSQIINPMSGETLVKHKDFIFVGAANTNGKGATQVYTGRTRLDAATLDRFVIFNVDYDQELEKELCPDETLYNILNEVRRELKNEGQDEFVSTRAFKNLYRLNQSGLDLDELFAILTANWGDQSTKIAMNVVQSAKKGKPKSGKKAELSKIEIPF